MSGEIISCPYNSAHKMHRKRLIPHLVKCKQLYPNIELRTCPFNLTHLMREEEYSKHLTSCPDKKVMTDFKIGGLYAEEEKVIQPVMDETENWDDDIVEDFDPKQKVVPTNTLIQPVGLLRSEKRAILKHEAETFVEVIPVKEKICDDGCSNDRVLKKEKRPEIKFNRIKIRERMPRTDLGEVKHEVDQFRPLTPPPPSGIDWGALSSNKRDRSRSPYRY